MLEILLDGPFPLIDSTIPVASIINHNDVGFSTGRLAAKRLTISGQEVAEQPVRGPEGRQTARTAPTASNVTLSQKGAEHREESK